MADHSYSITNGILYCEFTVSGKDSSGNFTVSATIYNTASNTNAVGNPRLASNTTSPTATTGWQRIGTSIIYPGGSYSGSTTFSTGSTSAGTVYCSLLTDNLQGIYRTCTVDAYVDPTPEMSPISISVSPAEQTMGEVVTVSEYGGYYANVSQRQIIYNGSVIGSYSTSNWRPSVNDFEQYCTSSNSVTVSLRAYCTAASGATGGGYSNTVSLKLNLPSTYVPTCSHYYEILNPINGAIIGGQSGLQITLDPSVTPAGNTATIVSTSLLSVSPVPTSDTIPITTSNFTKNGNVYTCTTVPLKSGVPSYQFKCTFRITDSRGNVLDYETEAFRVSNFVPPLITIDNLNRDTATTGSIQITIEGESTSNPSRIDNTENTIANLIINDGENTPTVIGVKNNLTQTNKGYTLNYTIQNLTSGSQYNVSFTYKDLTMYSYGETAYTYTSLLSTLAMPISLYDNGSRMAVSFGEECADNYGEDMVVNFAKDAYIRYIKNNSVVLIKVENAFSSCPYNVGDIYITTLSSNPSTIWGGTTWTQLEDKFLLGAGNSYTLGSTGGESEHTLTINEIPSHTHNFQYQGGQHNRSKSDNLQDTGNDYMVDSVTAATGGGQAHNNMPPYLVVNMWQRLT